MASAESCVGAEGLRAEQTLLPATLEVGHGEGPSDHQEGPPRLQDHQEDLSRLQDHQEDLSRLQDHQEDLSRLQDHLVSPTVKEPVPFVDETSSIQWFGVDIGGTLVKCVYFETQGSTCGTTCVKLEHEGVLALRKFVKSNLTYGSSGMRDEHLELRGQRLGRHTGTLHFIKFATSRMDGFFDMVTKNGLSKFSKVVCATGGGAFKFEKEFKTRLGIDLHKFDEMDCLIRGLHYLSLHCPNECYYWKDPKQENTQKVAFDLGSNPYPYIIVNIGSGVSILLVESATSFSRIGGTSVGGGTFLGLCAMLTGIDSFEKAIELAEKGDSNRVDKLVQDIYGGEYTRFGLSGDVVASSFGHMTCPERREGVSNADLAKATLVTVTNNIAAIARMCARISGVEKVLFVGNYLCGNKMSMQMLAFAMEYWSRGNTTVRALFLEHEGYFGALGSMLFLDPNVTQY